MSLRKLRRPITLLSLRVYNVIIGTFFLFFIGANIEANLFDRLVILLTFIEFISLVLSRGKPVDIIRSRTISEGRKKLGHQVVFLGAVILVITVCSLYLTAPTIWILLAGVIASLVSCINQYLKINDRIAESNFLQFFVKLTSRFIFFFGFHLFGKSFDVWRESDIALLLICSEILTGIVAIIVCGARNLTPDDKTQMGVVDKSNYWSNVLTNIYRLSPVLLLGVFQPEFAGDYRLVLSASGIIMMIYSSGVEDKLIVIRRGILVEKSLYFLPSLYKDLLVIRVASATVAISFLLSGSYFLTLFFPDLTYLFLPIVIGMCWNMVCSLMLPYHIMMQIKSTDIDKRLKLCALLVSTTLVISLSQGSSFLTLILFIGVFEILRKIIVGFCFRRAMLVNN